MINEYPKDIIDDTNQTYKSGLTPNTERLKAEEQFVRKIKEAEESVAAGNYVTISQLHEFLGV